jgi:hypothetical protein
MGALHLDHLQHFRAAIAPELHGLRHGINFFRPSG